MNEKEVAKKLASLKTITLSDRSKLILKKKIFQAVIEEKDSQYLKKRPFYQRPAVYMLAIAVFVILLLSIFFLPQRNIRSLYYAERIALTNNHYMKTKLAFAEARQNFEETHDSSSIQQVMAQTAETNFYISRLHLEGEKGKYTKEQCEQLYKEYATFLGSLKNRLAESNLQGYEAQVHLYQQQAASRMSYYKS